MVIVFAVIGILVTVIIQGSSMIGAARLNGARSFTAKAPVPNIEGLIAWYETSSVASFAGSAIYDGAQITSLKDISPNSLNSQRNSLARSASDAVSYVAEGINKTPSIKFDGTGNLALSSFYQGPLSQATIFLVFSPLAALSTTAVTALDSGATTTTSIGIKNNKISLNAGSAIDTAALSGSQLFSINNSYILAIYFNGASSQVFANNASTSIGAALLNAGTNQINGLTLGTARAGSSGGLNGLISEVIIFNRTLKANERRDVLKYLSEKYAILVNNL